MFLRLDECTLFLNYIYLHWQKQITLICFNETLNFYIKALRVSEIGSEKQNSKYIKLAIQMKKHVS